MYLVKLTYWHTIAFYWVESQDMNIKQLYSDPSMLFRLNVLILYLTIYMYIFVHWTKAEKSKQRERETDRQLQRCFTAKLLLCTCGRGLALQHMSSAGCTTHDPAPYLAPWGNVLLKSSLFTFLSQPSANNSHVSVTIQHMSFLFS